MLIGSSPASFNPFSISSETACAWRAFETVQITKKSVNEVMSRRSRTLTPVAFLVSAQRAASIQLGSSVEMVDCGERRGRLVGRDLLRLAYYILPPGCYSLVCAQHLVCEHVHGLPCLPRFAPPASYGRPAHQPPDARQA